ncbi:glycosyltransferase, partial [Neobacillus niacini]|uniref:glycosyltransferase n=1 Tax=Neobacillus niacini TaxID=86668 RepID=UPI002FFF33AC
MKVTYLCAKHPPYDGRIHYKICPTLKKRGYKIVNIHPNINDTDDNGIKLVGYKQKSGFIGRIKSFRAMYIAGLIQQPDVIFAPEPDSLLIAYLLKRKNKRLKVIFDCHEWYNLHFTHVAKLRNLGLARVLNKLITFVMQFLAKRINAVITVNDTMTEYFKKYNSNSYTVPSIMSETYEMDLGNIRRDYIYFGQFGNGGQEQILLDSARILKREGSTARIVIIGGYHPKEKNLI